MYKAEASVFIEADIGTVWSYVSNYGNFHQFMSHIAHVEMLSDQTSQWTLKGPLGYPVIWKAVSRISPAREIAWQSIEGAIKTSGRVTTDPANQGTQVTVEVNYTPPGGAIGQVFALLFKNPNKSLAQDLEHLKQIIEANQALGKEKVSATSNPLESELIKRETGSGGEARDKG